MAIQLIIVVILIQRASAVDRPRCFRQVINTIIQLNIDQAINYGDTYSFTHYIV